MKLRDTWPEIIKSQKLGQSYRRSNKYRGNLKSKF